MPRAAGTCTASSPTTPVFTIVSTVLTLGVVSYYADLTGKYLHLNLLDEFDSTPLQIGILILFHNFFYYWTHRLVHILAPLWELHKYHHSATELNIITNFRTHPVEGPLANALTAAPFALIGGNVEYFVYVGYLITIHAMILHSSIDYDFGFVGRWILVSPLHHRLHHSVDPRHYNRNFGTFTPIYDRIFGTYGAPEMRSAIVVGVDDNSYNREDFVLGIWHGWKRCCVRLFFPDSARSN